jgi:hypothetical protein
MTAARYAPATSPTWWCSTGNPSTAPVSAIGETSVAETYVAGRPVYRAA